MALILLFVFIAFWFGYFTGHALGAKKGFNAGYWAYKEKCHNTRKEASGEVVR